jgi:hypothetical protein
MQPLRQPDCAPTRRHQIRREAMSRQVWKFPIGTVTVVSVPSTAKVTLVALDPATGQPAIWLEVDQDLPKVQRMFGLFGTGHSIEGNGGFPSPLHVGSVVQAPFVWHVYELRDHATSDQPA